ncbi:MAG TPA: adenylate/guanylate cyclase domain-containing protein [Anaerolineales bacterium]|nr:adenylate/guanylate cyclase domain-containing protein [Anaerolineales bacterium]
MAGVPSGTVTFLFTDIEGSTKLAQEYPDEMPVLLARHNEILHQSIEAHNGYVFQIVGDSFSAAFHSASDALNAALNAQRGLQNESWTPAPIKVRMGIHAGAAQLNENKQYTSYATLAMTQRIMSAGHGGQVLISNATQELLRDGLSVGLSLRDMGERRLKDLIRPERLYQLISPNLLADFPPLKTLDLYRHNLPTQLTSFIGRGNEIGETTKLIAEYRVLTLTGSGGAGKTRLSLQVGAECLDQFPNGVWFVELASFTEPSLIVGSVMSVLGWQEKENDIHMLAKYIGSQSLLLILDNCEHLIEDCARLVETLIQSCPKLRVLASSREAFGIAGERPYHVPSLPFPDPKHLPSLGEIAAYESVQLFIERVRTFVPSFALTEKNASSVAQICSHLDGIPLALELAAARVKVMSVEQMAARLGDIFNLLTSGNRTALPRQQTLRALIEWSYDLLSDSEKILFRRLAAFSGGWSLEAAESVCSVEGRGTAVLDDLARLVDKSLVVKEEVNGEARFHMLETIRQYAEFKMFASEEVDDVKNRHHDWFMPLAEEAEPKLRTGEQLTWLNRLELEHDNLRAALSWSIEQKLTEQALRIPSALAYFWEIHGHSEEGRNWFKQVLAIDDDAKKKHPFAWANAVHGVAALSAYTPQFQSYQPHVKEAVKIFREHGDDFRVGHTLYHLAYFPHFAGELDTAKTKYQESFDAYKKINNRWGMGECLHCIAHIAEQQGKAEEGGELYRQSLDLLKPIGDRWSLFHPVGDTALIALNKGELDTAKMILEESIQAFEELKNREWTSISINRLIEVLYEQGEYEHARKVNQGNLDVQRETNNLDQLSWSIELKGRIELAEGNLSSAHQLLDEALAISEKTNNQFSMGFLKTALGLIDCYEGNYAHGKEIIEIGIEKVRKEYASKASALLTYRSHALWLEKDIQSAAQSYRDTIKELKDNYFFIRIPECLEGLGKIAVVQNQPERAAHLFGAAEAMREKMGTPIPPVMRAEYEAHLQLLGKAFESSWRHGREMMMEEVIEFALEQ